MTTWIEPTRLRPRLWGAYRPRYIVGLTAVIAGVAATNLTSTYSLWFLFIGPAVQLVGWLVLPGALWRRLVVAVPCLVAGLTLLAGPDFVGAFAVLLAGWLLVRQRPLISYLTVLAPVAASFLLKAVLHEYGQNWVALLVGTLVAVASAWHARALAQRWAETRPFVRPAALPVGQKIS